MVLIGFIGLGRMGYAMAARLREKGFELIVWNRTRAKAENFSKEYGAVIAASPREVGDKADYVHVMVADDNASREVVAGSLGVLSAKKQVTIIEHSTITPQHSMFLNALARAKGFTYIEAPVIGGPRQARRGELLVLVAGSEDPPETIKALGETIMIGEVPKASAVKLAFNNMIFTVIAGLAESVALVEAYEVDYRLLMEQVLSRTFLKPLIERYGDRPFDKNYKASFTARLAGKDAAYVAEALREKGIPAIHASAISSMYSMMRSLGKGESDYTHLVLLLLELARQTSR